MDPKTLPQMPDLWRLSIDLIERTVTAEVCGRTSVRAFDSADEARLFYEGMSNGLSYGAACYAAGMDRAAEVCEALIGREATTGRKVYVQDALAAIRAAKGE